MRTALEYKKATLTNTSCVYESGFLSGELLFVAVLIGASILSFRSIWMRRGNRAEFSSFVTAPTLKMQI